VLGGKRSFGFDQKHALSLLLLSMKSKYQDFFYVLSIEQHYFHSAIVENRCVQAANIPTFFNYLCSLIFGPTWRTLGISASLRTSTTEKAPWQIAFWS